MSSQWGEFRLAWEAWLKRPGGALLGSLLVKLAAFDVVSVHYLPRMALNMPGGLRKHHCLTSDLQKRQEVKSTQFCDGRDWVQVRLLPTQGPRGPFRSLWSKASP